ncbi:hypothetical protein OAK05_08350, partial [Gammaproteobacteria bacterium]|nr:hypothetical protein [Gammaproteobacteria bacterium]
YRNTHMSTFLNDYIPANKLGEYSSGLFSSESTKWLIRNRHRNGLHPHCKKVNGRLFINTKGFQTWFEEHMA